MLNPNQLSDFEYFRAQLPQLFAMFGNQYVAIADKKILGWNTDLLSLRSEVMALGYHEGGFIIQEVGPDESCFTIKM